MQHIDLNTFRRQEGVLAESQWMLVVKSQDQLERRRRMLELRSQGRIGRIKPRATATGLLVQGTLADGAFHPTSTAEFREPRHICRLDEDRYLCTEMSRLLELDTAGGIQRVYTHPYFAFLHTVDLSADGSGALVVSSGYDAVFELDLDSGEETFRWFAWDHGFNPDDDGCWLAADPKKFEQYRAEGKQAVFIDTAEYGEQGLVTARRSAHPNVAVYDPHDGYRSLIVSVAHHGDLWRVELGTGHTTKVGDFLSQMPHGLLPRGDGWVVTNTTRGEWWRLDSQLRPISCCSLAGLGGKVAGAEAIEWIQQVVPVGDTQALFLDANRGLIAVDFEHRCYSVYQADPNWCIQDALFCDAARQQGSRTSLAKAA